MLQLQLDRIGAELFKGEDVDLIRLASNLTQGRSAQVSNKGSNFFVRHASMLDQVDKTRFCRRDFHTTSTTRASFIIKITCQRLSPLSALLACADCSVGFVDVYLNPVCCHPAQR